MIEINKNPSAGDLKWFGLIFAFFFALIGTVIGWRFDNWNITIVLAIIGGAVGLVYYVVPPLKKPIYVGWLYVTYPIGFVVSHLILGGTYYLVLTPIGLIMRVVGRDPMQRELDSEASTYWEPRKPITDSNRYFKQY